MSIVTKLAHLTFPHLNLCVRLLPCSAVEKLFKVKVASVKTATVAGKIKRVGKTVGKRSNWKKAYVALQEGSNIDFFEV